MICFLGTACRRDVRPEQLHSDDMRRVNYLHPWASTRLDCRSAAVAIRGSAVGIRSSYMSRKRAVNTWLIEREKFVESRCVEERKPRQSLAFLSRRASMTKWSRNAPTPLRTLAFVWVIRPSGTHMKRGRAKLARCQTIRSKFFSL